MGWLDKTFKKIIKSPLGKAAILGAGAYFGGPGIMSMLGKAGGKAAGAKLASLWAKPIVSKPLTNALMSYGLAKLTRAKNPEQAALWGAGMTLPFLGMEAQTMAKGLSTAGKKTSMWDVLLGKARTPMSELGQIEKARLARSAGFEFPGTSKAFESAVTKGWKADPSMVKDLPYWMKGAPTAKDIALSDAGGIPGMLQAMKIPFKFWNTAAPLMGGMYAARETRKQAWKRIQEERKKQLAWMYGVDPEDITGEMTNPWYDVTPPSFDWKYSNRGGIMDLDAGGDVSGPGTGTSDSINAKLSDGEFVMTAKAVENFGGGSRQAGANKMYKLMNQLDPQSETPQEGMA